MVILAPPGLTAELSLAPVIYRFDYAEFDSDGATLDRERGELAGLILAAGAHLNDEWRAVAHVQVLDGDVDYDGETQSGRPHETETEQRLLNIRGRLARRLGPAAQVFFGLGSWHWDRHILPRNGVSGLREEYRWTELELGVDLQFARTENGAWHAALSHLAVHRPRVSVDLREFGFGETRLRLGNDQGNRLLLGWSSRSVQRRRWQAALVYEKWDFGASDAQTISNGAVLATLTEPASESEHVAVQLSFTFSTR